MEIETNDVSCLFCGRSLCGSFFGVVSHMRAHARRKEIAWNEVDELAQETLGKKFKNIKAKS